MVSEGSWRDYGLTISSKQVEFSVFKNAAENAMYKICKNFKPISQNLKYIITDSKSKVLKNSNNLENLLKNTNWIPKNAKIIKCERFGNKRHRVLLSPKFKSIDGFHLHYLMSKHSGTGGYIVTPNGAKYLVEKSINVNVPVDHFLFNPNNSKIFKNLMPIQLYPAICEQVDNSSDIHIHREDFSYLSLSDILREFKRGYYEVRLLPKQLFQFLFMKYRLRKIIVSE